MFSKGATQINLPLLKFIMTVTSFKHFPAQTFAYV